MNLNARSRPGDGRALQGIRRAGDRRTPAPTLTTTWSSIVLQDTMITAEKTLAEEGEEDLVRGVRRVFQGKFREDAIEIVERLTGRKVMAFLSDHAIDEDVAIEAFVLVRSGGANGA